MQNIGCSVVDDERSDGQMMMLDLFLSLARGGPGFGGGVGDGVRVRRLHRIELVKRYLVSHDVGGLRERFFVTLHT